MKPCKKMIIVVGCLGLMIGAAGCASNDVVKKDESIGGKEATAKSVIKSDSSKAVSPVLLGKSGKNLII